MATDKIINAPYSMQQVINEVLGHLVYDEIGTIKLIPVTATLLSGYLDINVNISKSDYSELWQKIQNDSWVSKALATDVNTTTFKINSQSAPSNFKYIIKAKNIIGIDPTIHQANANFLDGLTSSAYAKTLGNPSNAFQVANAVNLNDAINLGQFSGSLNSSGYRRIPVWDVSTNSYKVMIEQWMPWSLAAGVANGIFNFPIAFPNAVMHLNTIVTSSDTTATYLANYQNLSLSSVRLNVNTYSGAYSIVKSGLIYIIGY